MFPDPHPNPQPLKIALVLGGGGAKGAYQLGVWKALTQSEFSGISIIAGTSVGALNAVLFSGVRDQAKSVWDKMAGFNRLGSTWISSVLHWIALWILLLTPLGVAIFAFSQSVAGRGYTRSAWIIVWCCSMSLFFTFESYVDRLLGFVASSLKFLNFVLSYLLVSAVVSPLFLFIGDGQELQFKVTPTHVFIRCAIVLTAIYVMKHVIPWYSRSCEAIYSRAMNSSLIDRKVLEDLIKTNLIQLTTQRSQKPPQIFVTFAQHKEFYDPIGGYEIPDQTSPSAPPGTTVEEWVPIYKRIDEMDLNAQLQTLLDSCALPFAFPNRIDHGESICDGGIVDNIPIAPVLANGRVDFVFVVPLNAKSARWKRNIFKYADEKWALFLKKDLHSKVWHNETVNKQYWDAFERSKPSRHRDHTKIWFIQPSKPLPVIALPAFQFITGTLNFTQACFDRWEALGEEDAKKSLDELRKTGLLRADIQPSWSAEI